MAAIVSGADVDWDAERRFRVTEVALAIIWVRLERGIRSSIYSWFGWKDMDRQ
jgi:hypothetical protein